MEPTDVQLQWAAQRNDPPDIARRQARAAGASGFIEIAGKHHSGALVETVALVRHQLAPCTSKPDVHHLERQVRWTLPNDAECAPSASTEGILPHVCSSSADGELCSDSIASRRSCSVMASSLLTDSYINTRICLRSAERVGALGIISHTSSSMEQSSLDGSLWPTQAMLAIEGSASTPKLRLPKEELSTARRRPGSNRGQWLQRIAVVSPTSRTELHQRSPRIRIS